MKLEKPVRMRGEMNSHWNSRRDAYRMELIESNIEQLQKSVKKLERKK